MFLANQLRTLRPSWRRQTLFSLSCLQVFSSVHLEPVLYSGRGERYDAYDAPPPPQPRQQAPAPPPPQQAHNEEHHQVLEDFDKILGSGTGTSLRSSKAASRRSTFTQEDRVSSLVICLYL